MNDWKEIAKLDTKQSKLVRICWPYDKYPDMQQLKAGMSVTLLDVDGPGVITNMHFSNFGLLDGVLFTESAKEADAGERLIIEITYDDHAVPDISMPLYAFLGDPHGRCEFYSTIYFAKVKVARNFRLPVPFEKHIRIVLKNPTRTDLIGYVDAQWKKLDELPDDCGYLNVAYKDEEIRIPDEVAELANIEGAGTVKAQWLCLGTDLKLAWNGEYVCEGNQEYYVDGETIPSLEYLGTEDAYGHSWGLSSSSSDGYSALTGVCHPKEDWTEISMLRCRTEDSIGFQKSLKVLLDYSQDYFAKDSVNPFHKMGVFAERERTSFLMKYQSCMYYYGER